MVNQFEVLQTYSFSGLFPIPLGRDITDEARILLLDFEVLREATSPSFSSRTNPPTSFYAAVCLIRDGYVLERRDVVFGKQRFYLQPAFDEQTMYALRCYDAINARRLQVAVDALGGSVVISTNPFSEDLTSLGIYPDLVTVSCYADTALSVRVIRLPVLTCFPDFPSPTPDPPVVPQPPAIQRVPRGQPVPLAQYSPPPPGTLSTDYAPNPLDAAVIEPPPFGISCTPYTVVYSFVDNGETVQRVNRFFGPIGKISVVYGGINPTEIFLECRGFVDFAPGTCQEFRLVSVERSGNPNDYQSPVIVSIT